MKRGLRPLELGLLGGSRALGAQDPLLAHSTPDSGPFGGLSPLFVLAARPTRTRLISARLPTHDAVAGRSPRVLRSDPDERRASGAARDAGLRPRAREQPRQTLPPAGLRPSLSLSPPLQCPRRCLSATTGAAVAAATTETRAHAVERRFKSRGKSWISFQSRPMCVPPRPEVGEKRDGDRLKDELRGSLSNSVTRTLTRLPILDPRS
jgi:hypothetical protein